MTTRTNVPGGVLADSTLTDPFRAKESNIPRTLQQTELTESIASSVSTESSESTESTESSVSTGLTELTELTESSVSTELTESTESSVELHTFMRIVLDEMGEDPDPVKPGSQGTVVDSNSVQVLVDWDEEVGRSLHLIPGVDRYHVLNPEDASELEKSFKNLAVIQNRICGRDGRDGRDSGEDSSVEDSRCPRCGQLFDCRRGAVSRRVQVCNISICPACGSKEAIEDFVVHGAEYGVAVDVTVPEGWNKTGFESEKAEDGKEKLKIDVLPLKDWYITKIWTGTYFPEAGENEDIGEVAGNEER